MDLFDPSFPHSDLGGLHMEFFYSLGDIEEEGRSGLLKEKKQERTPRGKEGRKMNFGSRSE